jgi:N-acetylglucosaminyldiphosphoundecaprenol N-acetyl-beta-D-mannosaminyltransferase
MKKISFPLHKVSVLGSHDDLAALPLDRKVLVNCLNAHSYNVAQVDPDFAEALRKSVLLADGGGVSLGLRFLSRPCPERIAGWDLFMAGMERLNQQGGTVFFLGATEETLEKIRERVEKEYHNIKVQTYSPPHKSEFDPQDNKAILDAVNSAQPDILWVGLGAPKQEKWAALHFDELSVKGWICGVGAVFDFYAGTVKRAPRWWQTHYGEWLHRFLQEPRRLWRRYLVGNLKFGWNLAKEKLCKA